MKRYVTQDSARSILHTMSCRYEGVPLSMRHIALEAAKSGDLKKLECLYEGIVRSIQNTPFILTTADPGQGSSGEVISIEQELTTLKIAVEKALVVCQLTSKLEECWRERNVSNRAVWMLEKAGRIMLVEGYSIIPIPVLSTPTFPENIARSFHPAYQVDLPDTFWDWLISGDPRVTDAGAHLALRDLSPKSGYDLARIDGLWQAREQRFTEEEYNDRRPLDLLAYRLYEKGLDIGAPDDELRALLDPFINPT